MTIDELDILYAKYYNTKEKKIIRGLITICG